MSLGKTEMKRGTLTNQNESSGRSRSCNIDSLLEDDGQGGQNMKPSHPSRWLLSHATTSSLAKPTLPSTRVNLTSGTSSIFYPEHGTLSGPTPQKGGDVASTLRTEARQQEQLRTLRPCRPTAWTRPQRIDASQYACSSSPRASKMKITRSRKTPGRWPGSIADKTEAGRTPEQPLPPSLLASVLP